MKEFCISYCYYDQPQMLAEHYRMWSTYDRRVLDRVEFIVVDDGSPNKPAHDVDVPLAISDRVRVFRIIHNMPWNQLAARNIAADQSKTEWIFQCHLDHVLPPESAAKILNVNEDVENTFYTFNRCGFLKRNRMFKNGKIHFHPDAWLLKTSDYWRLGGYDERLAGIYGGDKQFLRKVYGEMKNELLEDVFILYYGKGSTIPDNMVPDSQLNRSRHPKNYIGKVLRHMELAGVLDDIETLTYPWKQMR